MQSENKEIPTAVNTSLDRSQETIITKQAKSVRDLRSMFE